MRAFLAGVLLIGLSVLIAHGDEKPKPSTLSPKNDSRFADEPPCRVTPEKDVRLRQLKGSDVKQIGVLSYYPNRGGGYTFKEGDDIVFYALPSPPAMSAEVSVIVAERTDKTIFERVVTKPLPTVRGTRLPFGGLTLFRGQMMPTPDYQQYRKDIPIAKWTRDTPTGRFRLSVMDVDSETRVKVKSIVPVLEHAPNPPPSKP